MTKLANEAFAKLRELDDAEQDRLAQLIIDDIEMDKRWDAMFAKSQGLLEEMANSAKSDYESGLTDELTPDKL